jgi:hypothetical protein
MLLVEGLIGRRSTGGMIGIYIHNDAREGAVCTDAA